MPIVKKTKSVEEFERLIEAYKVQNPVKFAMKEKALMAKLALLKGVKEPEEKEKEAKEPKGKSNYQ